MTALWGMRRCRGVSREVGALSTVAQPTSPSFTQRIAPVAVGIALIGSGCGSSRTHAPATTTVAVHADASTTTALVSQSAGLPSTRPPSTDAPASSRPSLPPATTPAPVRPTVTSSSPPPACGPTLAGRLATTGSAAQLITVDAPTYRTTSATVTLWQRHGGCWVLAGGPWAGRIGGSGFSDHHREGDETTPTGAYAVGPVVYGNAPDPGIRLRYHVLVCGDWWDEDPSSPTYNTFEHVACGQRPAFGGGSEALWQETAAYPSFAVVEYNSAPVVAGAGSAIFVHADVGSSTAGCVSLPLTELDTFLRWLDPAAAPLIVMGPDSEIARF